MFFKKWFPCKNCKELIEDRRKAREDFARDERVLLAEKAKQEQHIQKLVREIDALDSDIRKLKASLSESIAENKRLKMNQPKSKKIQK